MTTELPSPTQQSAVGSLALNRATDHSVNFFAQLARAALRRAAALVLAVTTFALIGATSTSQAQVVSNNFDDGTTQGWSPRGPVTVTSSTDVSHSGTSSLKTTGRTAGWNGPSLDLLTRVPINATYQVSAWVRLVSGQPTSNLKLTLERTPTSGTTTYAQVTTPQAVTSGAWVQIQGTLTLPAETNSGCNLYLESDDVTSAYYMDDFTIVALTAPGCPEPHDQTGLNTDFENGTAQGWTARGAAALTNVSTTAQSGTHSLAVTGRAASWQGPSINALCKLHKGSKYLISIWARLLPGEAASQLRVSLQAGLSGVTSYLTVIGNTPVTDAGWVNLSAEYNFSLDVDNLSLYVESDSGTSSFYIDSFSLIYLPAVPIQTDIPSLKTVLAPYFPIGTEVEPGDLVGQHGDLLLKHFDLIVAGNSMKWDATEPSEGVFSFARADTLANFARAHGLRMRGHNLLWHNQNPDWLFKDANGNPLQAGNPAHRTLLLNRLHNHIHTIVSRYADIVDSWDVVNEVVADSGAGLRDSPWLQIVGPDFVDYAFRYAKEVSGPAALFINDYNTYDPAKQADLKTIVQGLLDRHIPVDGVGHQMHVNVSYPSIASIRQTLQLFAGMGLMNEVTEMDVSVYTNSTDTTEPSAALLIQQGYRYRDIFNLYRELSPIINSVTLWGMSDDTSWLKTTPITRDDKPLLFDEELQAKPAYWGVVDPTHLPIVPKSLNVTQGTSLIVGQLQPFWTSLAPQALSSVNDNTAWGQFRAVWKNNQLYVFADVTDLTRSAKDIVDLYVGTAHYAIPALGLYHQNGVTATILPSKTGYQLFALVPTGQTLAIGSSLKFDIRVTDSAMGKRISWSDTKNAQDTDLTGLGTLTMTASKQVARSVRGTAIIDGIEDPIWNSAEAIQTQRFVLGSSGATARVRTLWDDGHLYIFAQVTDPILSKASANPWEQDSVEIFVDSNNGQTPIYESDDAQYRVNYDNERSFGGAATSSTIVSATRRVSGGYVVEAAITVNGLGQRQKALGDAAFIGFDVQVNNDGAGNGVRTSVSAWNDTSGNDYQDTSHFGALQLIGAAH